MNIREYGGLCLELPGEFHVIPEASQWVNYPLTLCLSTFGSIDMSGDPSRAISAQCNKKDNVQFPQTLQLSAQPGNLDSIDAHYSSLIKAFEMRNDHFSAPFLEQFCEEDPIPRMVLLQANDDQNLSLLSSAWIIEELVIVALLYLPIKRMICGKQILRTLKSSLSLNHQLLPLNTRCEHDS
ncbi:MAG: hypothetical protein VYA34_08585 [Myxococcota bacterium]|nr:hypothetical protein [Myxococcota bacterium]